jgi:hypothetical protein
MQPRNERATLAPQRSSHRPPFSHPPVRGTQPIRLLLDCAEES